MTVGLGHYLAVAAILFTLGILGIFINRKNVIVILMSIELILLAVNINLVAFSSFLNDLVGQVFALLVLTVAAAEAAIGLAILVVFYRARRSIGPHEDRKSTRLNSSHDQISYAVFCLKKKKKQRATRRRDLRARSSR